VRGILTAAAASGAVGAVANLLVWIVRSSLPSETFEDVLNGIFVAVVFGLAWLVVAPLLAGVCGGLASRSFPGVAGSIFGFLAVTVIAVAIEGIPPDTGSWGVSAVMFGVLVAAGHLTGVAVRPRIRTA
jgi:hypothetical protein